MSICIVPIHEKSLRRSGIQHAWSRDITDIPAHPAFHPQSESAIPAFAFPAAQLVFNYRPRRDERLSNLGGMKMTGIGLDVFSAQRRLCFYRRYLLSFCLFISRITPKLAHIPRKIPLIFDGTIGLG